MKKLVEVLFLALGIVVLLHGQIFSQACLTPSKVEVLPVFFVPKNVNGPVQLQKDKLKQHILWSQERYHEMMKFRSTFELADSTPHVYHAINNDAFYKSQADGGASQYVNELLTHYGYTRFDCPYIFLVVYMSPNTLFPVGGGRPINAGFNTGGGVIILSSYELDNTPNFQSTLQHELGHSFGLPHVNTYGYDMNTNSSIMSYNLSHHTNYFNPSPTPGILIPENLRDLSLNKLVFPDMYFDPVVDVPSNYTIFPRIVYLGILDIPNHTDYRLKVKTTSGETFGSRVENMVQHEIKPSIAGMGTTYDANNMWHSGTVTWAEAEVRFPFSVTLDKLGVHSQHSGISHEADSVKIETYSNGAYQLVSLTDLTNVDQYVSFNAATDSIWRFSFRAGVSKYVVVRGLEFFNQIERIFPPLIPYAYQNPFGEQLPDRPTLINPVENFITSEPEVNFDWISDQSNAYRLQIDTNTNFCLPLIDTLLMENLYDEQFPLNNKKYYWRVKGLNNFGEGFGPWSKSGQFFTGKNTDTDDTDPDRFFIYPNPTYDRIQIQYDGNNFETEVWDITGKMVLRTSNSKVIDVGGLPTGVYVLHLKDITFSGKKVFVISR